MLDRRAEAGGRTPDWGEGGGSGPRALCRGWSALWWPEDVRRPGLPSLRQPGSWRFPLPLPHTHRGRRRAWRLATSRDSVANNPCSPSQPLQAPAQVRSGSGCRSGAGGPRQQCGCPRTDFLGENELPVPGGKQAQTGHPPGGTWHSRGSTMCPVRRELVGAEVPPPPSPPGFPTLCVRAREELPTFPVHKKESESLVRVVFITPTAGPGAHFAVTATSDASLNRPRGVVVWGGGPVSSPPTSARCSPPSPHLPPPCPQSRRHSAFLAAGGMAARKELPYGSRYHLLKGERPLSRAGSKLGPGVWLLRPQGALGFILMLPRHLEGSGGGAGEGAAPGGLKTTAGGEGVPQRRLSEPEGKRQVGS